MSYLKSKLNNNRIKFNILGFIILFLMTFWSIQYKDTILQKIGLYPYPTEGHTQPPVIPTPFGEVISVAPSDKKGELRVCFEQKPDETNGQGSNCRVVPIECIMRVFPDKCKVEEYIFIPHVDCSTRKCDKTGCSKECLTVRIKEIEKSKHLTIPYDIGDFYSKCTQCSRKEQHEYCEDKNCDI